MKDQHGNLLSGATAASLEAFEAASHLFRCYAGDPLALASQAASEAPQMTMAHVLIGWLNLLGTEPAGLPAAREALTAARRCRPTEREAGHLRALELVTQGKWLAAGQCMEDLSVQYPHDLLALQVGHQVDFFTGQSRMLRDRMARAMPAWSSDMPGYHAMLSMYAFGLEETGAYARAEDLGREAAAREPRDGWAWHAVAHVLEMQDRREEGIAWLRQDTAAWSDNNFLAVHNWWHLALFNLGLGRYEEVLRLLDENVLGTESSVVLEMIDASALLWRLSLLGVDVSGRWDKLSARWAAVIPDSNYAFNDFHAMMAFVGAGREDEASRLVARQAMRLRSDDDNARFTSEVGRNATLAIRAFGQERYDAVVDLLRPIRGKASIFGGSHAQRDVIDLTLMAAAAAGGNARLHEALVHERKARAMALH